MPEESNFGCPFSNTGPISTVFGAPVFGFNAVANDAVNVALVFASSACACLSFNKYAACVTAALLAAPSLSVAPG